MIICTATAAKLVKVKMLNDIAEQDMNISTEQKGKYFMSSKVYIIEKRLNMQFNPNLQDNAF